MHPDLEVLLGLQVKDGALEEAQLAVDALQPETQALEDELEAARQTVEQAKQAVVDSAQRRDELEGRIENYRVLQERHRQRLEFVRGAKEASALMAEIDMARTVMAREEAEWVRSADSVNQAELRVASMQKAREELAERLQPKQGELDARSQELEARVAEVREDREVTAKQVKQALLAQYNRLRQGKARRPLVPLHGEACGNCFTTVPMQRRVHIVRGDAIEHCEACGVMLYGADTSE